MEILLLEPIDDLPIVSLAPEKEAMLLDELQEAQATATHLLGMKSRCPKPVIVARLEEAATEAKSHESGCCHPQDLDHCPQVWTASTLRQTIDQDSQSLGSPACPDANWGHEPNCF